MKWISASRMEGKPSSEFTIFILTIINGFLYNDIIFLTHERKDLIHCWSILLKQKVGSSYCYMKYMGYHTKLLDFFCGPARKYVHFSGARLDGVEMMPCCLLSTHLFRQLKNIQTEDVPRIRRIYAKVVNDRCSLENRLNLEY